MISAALKSIIFYDYNRGIKAHLTGKTTVSMTEIHTLNMLNGQISPKVKETHLKIHYEVYPVSEFLKIRFKIEVVPFTKQQMKH